MRVAREIDIQLYSLLYETYAPRLLYYARKFVPYPAAEDIVHDIFLNLWKNPRELKIDKTTVSYMFQSVQNACLNYLKHESIHKTYMEKMAIELKMEELSLLSPEKELIDKERINAIYSAINRLPDKCRTIFRLSYLENKTNAEIAKALHLSVRTVESQLYKALVTLRKELLLLVITVLSGYFFN